MAEISLLDAATHSINLFETDACARFWKVGGQGAKQFRVGREVVEKIAELAREHPDLYESQRLFAKAPFPNSYVEFDMEGFHSGYDRLGVLVCGDLASVVVEPDRNEGKAMIGASLVVISDEGFRVRSWPGSKQELTADDKQAAARYVGFAEVLWLLMHRPGVVKVQQVPGKQKVIRGKLRPMRAHSVLTIDLAAKDIVRTIIGDGRKGSGVREHEVRGTWVHLKHDRSCEHQWSKVERPPLEPDTFQCPCCGTKRVWRKDHVRGEHSRGNKFNTYQVVDSRLKESSEKRPRPS